MRPWLTLLLCLTAHAEPSPSPAPSELIGRVFERGSAVAIAGATVATADATVTTDAQGRFSLTLPAGEVAIAVVAAGYEPFHLQEQLPPNTRRTVEYRLQTVFGGRYRSVVRGQSRHEGERFTVRDEELQQAPGAGGDPLRIIATLPGVVAPIPLLPIYVVRGGSPGMNGFYLDGMRVPELFHLVFVDGVVHPRILDRLDFFPGTYDATFGRNASGVIDAATRPGRSDAPVHTELELKLYDASALIETRIPGGITVEAAGRYGYPGPILKAVQPGIDLTYWDYQLRIDWKGLTVEAIGSYDALNLNLSQITGNPGGINGQFLVEFHRLQIREQWHKGRWDVEAALVGGIDRMAIFTGEGVQKLGLSARLNARVKFWWLTLSAGADTEISRFTAENFESDQTRSAPDALGDLAGNRDGVVGGAFAQATLALDKLVKLPLTITAGVRADVYHAGNVTLLGVDPRILFSFKPLKQLEIFGGFGQYSQSPSFPVPLPGIDTFALELGLQRSVQGSLGLRFKLPWDLTVSATGYYGRFYNINDVVLDFEAAVCTSPPPESLKGIDAYTTRQIDGAGYGLELLVRRQSGRVTGWLSYTLSRAERIYSCGLAPADFDQTHTFNAVMQVRLPWRLLLGIHLNVATGRPYTLLTPDFSTVSFTGSRNNARMPTYVQLDLRIDREWIYRRWALALFIELLNLTYSESDYGVTYPKDPMLMITRYDQPQFEGFRWILPSIGIRARF